MSKNVYKQMMEQAVPSAALIHKTKSKMKEETLLIKKKISVATVAFAVMVMITTTAFAAWYFLKPSDVANKFNDSALAAAFDSETAVNINKSITSGDYTFTPLALVSGKDITNHPTYNNNEILSDRTYAVLAIQKADGSPMPSTQDDEYGRVSFIASPLVKGLQPWRVNAWTMNGGHSEIAADGILYRIVECDSVAMFADRGVYLGAATGSFINNSTFVYNENTGEIKANPDYDGSSVVFELPIDKSLADPIEAQKYLDTMWADDDSGGNGDAANADAEADKSFEIIENAEKGEGIRRVMSYDEYKAWMEQKLAETQKIVDRGEYSEAAMELDLREYESNLKEIENGATLTMIEYKDGSYRVSITYPNSGYDVDIADDGGIIISD